MVEDAFGRQITVAHARRLQLGEIASTEEYALLSVLLGMGPEALFTKEQILPKNRRYSLRFGRKYGIIYL